MSDVTDCLARVTRTAEETFGDPQKARAWLHRPNRALGGVPPVRTLESDGDAERVDEVLGRLAHGLFS